MSRYAKQSNRDAASLPVEQRLAVLERQVSHLGERLDGLARGLKEQRELITEYITKQMVAAGKGAALTGQVPAEAGQFIFICNRRFKKIETELARVTRLVARCESLRHTG
jgi:hypothetical protein